MKKKISNYILFPVLLGSVCIVCSASLAAVNYLAAPYIENNKTRKITNKIGKFFKDNKNYTLIYDRNDKDVVDPNPISSTPAEFNSQIIRCFRVTTSDDKLGLVYHMETTTGYSGNLELVVGVFESAVIGLAQVGGSEDGLGVNAINKLADKLGWDSSYLPGDDLKDLAISAGASAKLTVPVVQAALDIALADEKNRIKSSEVTSTVEVSSVTEVGFDEVKCVVSSVSEANYASMKAEVVLDVKGMFSYSSTSIKIKSVTLLEKDDTENSGEGKKVLDGTATDKFTTSSVVTAGKTVTFKNFSGSLEAEVKKGTFEDCAAPNTARGYFLMLNGLYKHLKANQATINILEKTGENEYRIKKTFDGLGFASIDLSATVDSTSTYFTKIVINGIGGTPAYGSDILIDGTTNGLDSSINKDQANKFIENFIKISGSGLPISKFENPKETTDNELVTGATQSTYGYYTALHEIVMFIKGGN